MKQTNSPFNMFTRVCFFTEKRSAEAEMKASRNPAKQWKCVRQDSIEKQ